MTDSHDSDQSAQNRGADRYEVRLEGWIEPLDERDTQDARVSVTVLDVGRTGVRLACDVPLDRESMWRLRLIEGHHLIAAVPIMARYCKSSDAHGFHIGAQFVIEPYLLHVIGVEPDQLDVEDALYGQIETVAAAG